MIPKSEAGAPLPEEQVIDQELTEANPFNPRMGAGEDVAMSRLPRKLVEKLFGRAAKEAPEAVPEPKPPTKEVEMLEEEVEAEVEAVARAEADAEGRTQERNINTNLLEDEDSIAVIQLINREKGGFKDIPQRRVRTHEETIAASQSEESLKRVLSGDINQKWEPEDIVFAYNLLDKMAKQLREDAQDIVRRQEEGIEIPQQELLQYNGKLARFTALEEIAAGRAAEAGRLLNAFQAVNKAVSGGPKGLAEVTRLVESIGGDEALLAKINLMASSNNLADTAGNARKAMALKLADKLLTWRYNLMLSSVRTHVANITGSMLTGVWEQALVNPTKVAIGQVEWVLRRSVGDKTAVRPPISDIVTRPYFHLMAVKQGLINAKKVFKGEMAGEGKLSLDAGLNVKGTGKLEIPGRLLQAEDTFFKSIYQQAYVAEWAFTRAMEIGGNRQTVQKNYEVFMASPPKNVIEEATEYGQKMTFTNDPNEYGAVIGTLANMAASVQGWGGGRVGRIILPFVRTPANLLGYAAEQATGGTIAPTSFWHKLASKNPEERADAIARFTIAAGLFTLLKEYYDDGTITGAPPGNYNEYKVREAAGWRPSSVRIGDKYYELNRSEPLGLIFGMIASTYDVANYAETDDKAFEMVMNSTSGVAQLLGDRSFLSGLSDFLEVIHSLKEGQTAGAAISFTSSVFASFVTAGILRDAREFTDEYRRDMSYNKDWDGLVNRMGKQFKNAFPGWSKDLPPSVDVFGDYIRYDENKYWRALVPMRTSKIEKDPAAAALMINRIPVTKPHHVLDPQGPGPAINLLDIDGGKGWVYHQYQKIIGQERRKAVEQFIKSKTWKTAVENGDIGPDTVAADYLRRANQRGMQVGKMLFLQWLEGRSEVVPMVDGEKTGEPIPLKHTFTRQELQVIAKQMMLKRTGQSFDKETLKAAKDSFYEIDETKKIKGLAPEYIPEF